MTENKVSFADALHVAQTIGAPIFQDISKDYSCWVIVVGEFALNIHENGYSFISGRPMYLGDPKRFKRV